MARHSRETQQGPGDGGAPRASNRPPKMTLATQLVLRELLANPAQERYGLELSQAAGLESGTIHPILARLEKLGWVDSRWEDADPAVEGRPRRRYYQLNPNGIEEASGALARARKPIAPVMPRPVVVPGGGLA